MEVCDCINLGIAGNGGWIRHFTCKDGHGEDDVVLCGKRRLRKVRVLELDGVRELLTLLVFLYYLEGLVLEESGANVKTVLAVEIPGEPCDRIFVYGETASNWSDDIFVVVKGEVEVLSS